MTQQTNPTPTTQDTELDEIRAIINQFGNWQSNKDFQPKKIAADIHQWAERKYGEREAKKLHKVKLCLIGKYAGDPIQNALDEIAEVTPTTTPNDERED